MRLSTREKVLLVALLMVFSWFVFYKYFLCPLRSEIDQLKARNQVLKQRLNDGRRWAGRESYLEEARDRLAESDRANAIRVPHRPGKAELVAELERLAVSNRLGLQTVEQQDPDRRHKGHLGSFTLTCRVTGGYQDIWRFLRGLEKGNRLVSVQGLSIRSREQPTGSQGPGAPGVGEAGLARTKATGEEPSPGSIGKSLPDYDGSLLTCDITLVAYFDTSAPGPGGDGLYQPVEPENQGVANPFIR